MEAALHSRALHGFHRAPLWDALWVRRLPQRSLGSLGDGLCWRRLFSKPDRQEPKRKEQFSNRDQFKREPGKRQGSRGVCRHKSNCPLCAIGHDANKSRIYKFDEMDADHVSAWSKGGGNLAKNCQMLCVTHNRAKGNR